LTTQQQPLPAAQQTRSKKDQQLTFRSDTYAITTNIKDARIHCAILNQHQTRYRTTPTNPEP
jgi:hypothetical protein